MNTRETATPRRFFRIDDTDLRAVCTVIGVKPDSGIVNRFNDLSEAGAFDDTETIGDLGRVVALDILAEFSRTA